MLALPAVPQDLTIMPQGQASSPAEVVAAMPSAITRAIEVRSSADYDAAMEELLELPDFPVVEIDRNQLFSAFGSEIYPFIESLGHFVRLRRLSPFVGARSMGDAVRMVRETIFSGAADLEYCRRWLAFMEITVGLHAMITAVHYGKAPTPFFTRALAERSLIATRELADMLEAIDRKERSSAMPAASTAKIEEWATKGRDGVYRPFGEHVD